MFAVGLGRVGRDIYFVREGSAERFDSRKTSVQYGGERLGGSIPAILDVLSSCGVACCQIAAIGSQRWAEEFVLRYFAEKNIKVLRVHVNRTPESVVLLRDDFSLEEIIVESEQDKFSRICVGDVTSIQLPSIPYFFIYDTRHAEAAQYLARRARGQGLVTFADPGSLGGIAGRREATTSALEEARIVFAAENTLEMLAVDGHPRTLVDQLLGGIAEVVVSTRQDGGCDVYGSTAQASLLPVDVRPVGSSVGAGDFCRGFTLSEIMRRMGTIDLPPFESIVEAVAVGLAAAAWRIEDSAVFPSVPPRDSLEPYIRRVAEANHLGS
jgi:sugar/nucleoside kinase (ribokinase family)